MQKYRLERKMQYTERLEVVVNEWDEAVNILRDPDTEFDRIEDDVPVDETVEYIGEV